jgi:RNA polymerase-binding transcription factor DksA
MPNHDISGQIEKLEHEHSQLQQELAALRELFKDEVDADIGAGDPKLVERDRIMALIQFKQQRLNTLEQALSEARQGLYGICERCGQAIDPARLEALPDTTLCIDCKRITEDHHHF